MRGCGAKYEYWYEEPGRGSLLYDDEDTIRMYDACYSGGKMVTSRCGGTNVWGEVGYCDKCEAQLRGEGIRVLSTTVKVGEDYDEGDNITLIVKLPKTMTKRLAYQILSARYDARGCSHEYDCCGLHHWGRLLHKVS